MRLEHLLSGVRKDRKGMILMQLGNKPSKSVNTSFLERCLKEKEALTTVRGSPTSRLQILGYVIL